MTFSPTCTFPVSTSPAQKTFFEAIPGRSGMIGVAPTAMTRASGFSARTVSAVTSVPLTILAPHFSVWAIIQLVYVFKSFLKGSSQPVFSMPPNSPLIS